MRNYFAKRMFTERTGFTKVIQNKKKNFEEKCDDHLDTEDDSDQEDDEENI